MSLAKLTSLSTQTLSLLLERQRLQSLPQFQSGTQSQSNLHLPQISRNLNALRTGILALEKSGGGGEAAGLLRNQYGRMRSMLGGDAEAESLGIQSLEQYSSPSPSPSSTPIPGASSSNRNPLMPPARDSEPVYSPYTDDPEAGYGEDPGIMLQTQKRMMDDQDNHLETLHSSLTRQHGLSLAINSELEEHHGLLEELDQDLEGTRTRLGGARKRLDKVAKGLKGNGSTVTIALLILVLLILIIVFKT